MRAAKDKYVPVLDILISEGVIRVPRTVFELKLDINVISLIFQGAYSRQC